MKRSRTTKTSLRSSVLSCNAKETESQIGKRLLAKDSKPVNETIILDSTYGTDIIECSVEESGDRYDFLKTPKSNLKRFVAESRNDVISVEDVKVKAEKTPSVKNNNSSRKSLKGVNFDNGSIISLDSITTPCKIHTPKPNPYNKYENHPVMSKVVSTLKKTPDVPYLTKSKLRNIEKWLCENDIETVRTPPFANLSVTPINSKKKCVTPGTRKRKSESDASSIDSEVKKVLIAVYGDDWREKNVLKKCRTEPKKKQKIIPLPKTEIKPQKGKATRKLIADEAPLSVRRNILGSAKKTETKKDAVNHDDSSILGVEEINLDQSNASDGFEIAKNFSAVKRKRTKNIEDDLSSTDSWKPQSTKKKKVAATPVQSAKKETPKVRSTRTRQLTQNPESSKKTPKKTFLASLSLSTPSGRCHPEAQDFKINFKTKKEELAKKLYKLYNSEVFGDKLPSDMSLTWNVKLRGTAGFCYNKRITKSTGEVIRSSRIEFSTKVIDRADRLRDTLIHELCHAASWVIDGVLDGHGNIWGGWAQKAMERFPELPPIKRCHNYEIMSKYTYRCTGCGYSINRHSKSIDTERKRCGYCYGVLELLVNKKRRGKGEVPEYDTTRTIKTPNNFALFVKENYHSVKSTRTNAKHAEIMKILSQQYAIVKNAGKPQPLPAETK